jgi:hypothetical protein
MALKNFHKVIAETSEEVGSFVEQSLDILERIHELLEEKFDGRQNYWLKNWVNRKPKSVKF